MPSEGLGGVPNSVPRAGLHGLLRQRKVIRAGPFFASTYKRSELPLSCCFFVRRELANLKAMHAVLPSMDLTGRNLSCADFRGSTLRDVKFNGANLTNAKLAGVDLKTVTFDGATVTNTDISGADLSGCELRAVIATAARHVNRQHETDSASQGEAESRTAG